MPGIMGHLEALKRCLQANLRALWRTMAPSCHPQGPLAQTLASFQAGAAKGQGGQAHQGGTPAEPPRALARLPATSSTSEIPAWRVSHFGGWAIVTTADSRTAWGEEVMLKPPCKARELQAAPSPPTTCATAPFSAVQRHPPPQPESQKLRPPDMPEGVYRACP